MSRFINAYAWVFEHCRWLVAVAVIVTTGVAVNAIRDLHSSDNLWKLFMDHGAAETASDDPLVNDNICLVSLESDSLFTPQGMSVVRDLHTSLSETAGVDRVTSLCDMLKPVLRFYRRMFPSEDADAEEIESFREEAVDHPMVKGQLLTADGRATLLIVELDPAFHSSGEYRPVIDQIAKQVSERTRGEDIKAEITGPTVIQVRAADALVKDQIIFNVAGPIMAVVIAAVLFRRMSSVLIVTAAPIVGVIWTLGWFALTGEELNPINGVVAPLALTIGLTDAVHTLLHIRQGIAAGSTPHAAAGHAIREVGAACLLTSLTTAIGFASLEIAEFKLLRDFGRDCAAAVVIAFLAVMTIVPLLGSTWIGRRTVPKNMQANTDQKPRHRLAGTWYMHAVRFSIRNRVAVMVGGIAATVLLIAYARNLELDVRVRRGLPIGSPTQLAYLDVDQQFGGSLPFTLLVEWSRDDPPESDELVDVVTAAHNALADSDISSPPLSMLTIFELIPGSNRSSDRLVGELLNLPDERLSLFYDEELGHALIVTRFQDVGSQAITDQLNRLDATLAAVAAEHPQFRFVMPESPPTALRSAGGILFDLLDSLFMAVPVTMLILALALRSLRLGLISMIPNIFPMAALAGTMMVLGIPLQLTGATVFVMCFGIAVDDTIHALTVFRRLCGEGVPPLQAIEQGFDEIGDAIISTTIILIGGISVVILGQSVMTEFFGGLFIGGLLWAFVGDLLLLPAALACFAARQEATTESVQPSGQQSS